MSWQSILRRGAERPGLAVRVAMSIARGHYYRIKFQLLGRRVRIGRNFRVVGRLDIRGPGTVIFGDDCTVISSYLSPTTPYTHSPEAVIEFGNRVLLTGTRLGCYRRIQVADGAGLAEARVMDTDFHSLKAVDGPRYNSSGESAPVIIGRNAWVALSAIVLKGVTVGDNAVVGAGSVVVTNVPANSVVFGNPARVCWRLGECPGPGARRCRHPSLGAPERPVRSRMTSHAPPANAPSFGWGHEQNAFRDHVATFARARLSEPLRARADAEAFSRELWRACAEFGVHGIPFPEEYGGGGQDAIDAVVAMEALGYECADQGLLFSINAQMWSVQMPILRFGTEEQKRRYLPGLCDGTLIGAHGMSEPDSGSDAFAMRTRAVRDDDGYRITGSKTFVTNAPEADMFVVFATVNPKRGMWGVTAFLIDRDTPGLSVGKRIEKMGLTTSPMAEVVLEDCRVPATSVLGREGQGAAIFNHSMGWERACILGTTVGAMARQFETCLEYAKTRRQFGKPIGNFQLVASKIADMKLRLETSRLLLHKATLSQANDRDGALDGAMAKLHISDAAVQSGLDAIQIHGGYGYTREYEAERELRDAIGGRLYSGTSEIQRLLIARHLGLTPA